MSVARSNARTHAEMSPATKARVDAQAAVGRTIVGYGQAYRSLALGEVTERFVSRKRAELDEALGVLVELAQAEGRAS